MEMYIWWRF